MASNSHCGSLQVWPYVAHLFPEQGHCREVSLEYGSGFVFAGEIPLIRRSGAARPGQGAAVLMQEKRAPGFRARGIHEVPIFLSNCLDAIPL